MKKINFQKRIDSLNKMREGMERKLAMNAISEEARAEVEGRIAQLREIAEELESLRDAAADGDNDNSEELMRQMREVLARMQAVENSVKETTAANGKKKVNNTKEYQRKFFDMVQNSVNSKAFKENLKKLAVENSITITDGDISDLLPAAVLQEVNDVFTGHRHRLLEVVDWTGLPVFKAFYETGNDMAHTWPSEMLGQTASETAKTEQDLTFTDITIRPQYVYKTISIDKEVLRASEADGSVFIRYIVRELLDRLLCTIETYILTGNAENFIAPTATALQRDANINPKLHALNYLHYNAGLVAVVTSSFYADLLQKVQTQSNFLVVANADDVIRNILGVSEVIIAPPTFAPSGDQIGLYFMNPRAYKMVGDRRPDQYEDFNLSWNRVQYLMEMWVGGGSITPEFIAIENNA